MTEFGDAFSWPTKDPEWVSKILVIGLIGIIPIVGAINMLGWMLNAVDNLRAGRLELPPGNFSHLGRGVSLFVVLLIYGFGIAIACIVLFLPGMALSGAASQDNSGALVGIASLWFLLVGALAVVASLGLMLVQPLIYLQTDRRGIAGGLDFRTILDTLRTHFLKVLLAALLMVVGSFIGGLGVYVCFLGVIFTAPYGYAIMAGVLRVFEQQLAVPAAA